MKRRQIYAAYTPRLREWVKCGFVACLGGLVTFSLMGCSGPDRNITAEQCGPVTPSYFYFNKIAPSLRYPNNLVADTTEFYSQKNAEVPDIPTGGFLFPNSSKLITLSKFQNAYIFSDKISEKFTPQEVSCWAEQGD